MQTWVEYTYHECMVWFASNLLPNLEQDAHFYNVITTGKVADMAMRSADMRSNTHADLITYFVILSSDVGPFCHQNLQNNLSAMPSCLM